MTMDQKQFTAVDDLVGSAASKEREPVERAGPPVRPAASERLSHREVKNFIDLRPQRPKVSPDLQGLGVSAPEEEADLTQGKPSISLPISDDMVFKGLHAPIVSSLRWLAQWAEYLLQKAHLTLKKIHGRVVRVMMK